jgi:hypothetical protein
MYNISSIKDIKWPQPLSIVKHNMETMVNSEPCVLNTFDQGVDIFLKTF